jgi:sRNA-binding regulator protein Hfq
MDEKKPLILKPEKHHLLDFIENLPKRPKREFPIEEDSIIGKTVTVSTIDGEKTTGVIISAKQVGLGLKNDTGNLLVFTKAIAAIHFHEQDK